MMDPDDDVPISLTATAPAAAADTLPLCPVLPEMFWAAAALAAGLRAPPQRLLPRLPLEKRFVRLQRSTLTRQNGTTVEVTYPLLLMPDLLHNIASMIRRISRGKPPLILGKGTVSLASLEALFKENRELQSLLRPSDFAPLDRQNVSSALRLIHPRVIQIALENQSTHELGIYLSAVADYFHGVHTPGLSLGTRLELVSSCVSFTIEWLMHCRADLPRRAVKSSKKESSPQTRYCFSSSCIRAVCLALINLVALTQWFGQSTSDCVRDVLPAMTWLFCRCAIVQNS